MARDYLTQYLNGQYEAVWDSLTALGDLRGDEETRIAAMSVAQETMRRVKTNIQTLAERLTGFGFRFGEGLYDDETEEERRRLLAEEPV